MNIEEASGVNTKGNDKDRPRALQRMFAMCPGVPKRPDRGFLDTERYRVPSGCLQRKEDENGEEAVYGMLLLCGLLSRYGN